MLRLTECFFNSIHFIQVNMFALLYYNRLVCEDNTIVHRKFNFFYVRIGLHQNNFMLYWETILRNSLMLEWNHHYLLAFSLNQMWNYQMWGRNTLARVFLVLGSVACTMNNLYRKNCIRYVHTSHFGLSANKPSTSSQSLLPVICWCSK